MHSFAFTFIFLAFTLGARAARCTAASACVAGPIAGTTCEAQCGVTHPGGDYAATRTSTFQACAKVCSRDVQCVMAQFDKKKGYCYLKRIINQAATSSKVDTIICRACPAGDFRVQIVTPSGDVRYLSNTGETFTPARDGQTMADALIADATTYYLNSTMLTGVKPEADGALAVVHTWPGEGIAYALTLARNVDLGYDLLQVRLVPSVDKCNVFFRRPNGDSTTAIYQDSPEGDVAFFIQSASSTANVPVKAVYAIPA